MNAQLPLSQLTPELRRELALARDRTKVIRKAASVAAFNGWVTAVITALSAPFALFSIVGFLVTCILAFVAYNEFRGRKRLLAFDPSAATLLGWNQLGFLAMISAYCGWMLFTNLNSFSSQMQANPELEEALGSLDEFEGLYRLVVVGLYSTVFVLSVIFQGLNALYYFTRRKYVEAYLQETPAYVQEITSSMSAN
jgi:hypothetical protein